MAEKSTFENELPKKSTVKWLRGLDENGNPVLIDISDNATVVGGLIGTATNIKNGLAPKELIPYEYDKPDNMVVLNPHNMWRRWVFFWHIFSRK